MSIVTLRDPMVLSVIDMGSASRWSAERSGCGGPELGGAAGGRDLGDAGAPGELERAKRVLDLVGWPVVLQEV